MYIRMQDGGICNLQYVQSIEKVVLYNGTFVVNAIFAPNQAVELFRGTEQECDKYTYRLWSQLKDEQMTLLA